MEIIVALDVAEVVLTVLSIVRIFVVRRVSIGICLVLVVALDGVVTGVPAPSLSLNSRLHGRVCTSPL